MCSQRTCQCDTKFVDGILDGFFDGVAFDSSFKHDQGWDPSVECLSVDNNHGGDSMCCGQYPERSPFRTGVNGDRQCCNGKVYNPFKNYCCNGDAVIDLLDQCN